MSRPSIPAVCAWLGALLLVASAWLFLPRERAAAGRPVRVLILDASASALLRGDLAAAEELVADARGRADREGRDLLGLAFGRGARAFDPAAPLASQIGAPEEASDLADALLLAERIAGSRRVDAITILSDGTWTGVDPAPAAARLAARGIAIEVVPGAPLGAGEDAGVAPFARPVRVRAGAPVAFDVEAWTALGARNAEPAATLVVTAELARGSAVERRSVRVPLAPDRPPHARRALRVAFEFAPLAESAAELVVRADLERASGAVVPGRPDDDEARTRVEVDGATVVAVLGEPARRAASIELLRGAAPDLALVEADDPGRLSDADVVVAVAPTFDADAAGVIDARLAAGTGYVELLDAGFAAGDRPVGAALVPAGDDGGPRDVLVLLDASGSMSGEPARAAAAALARLVDLAPRNDALAALWLADDGRVRVDLGGPGERADAARRAELRARALDAPEARGPTRLWDALAGLAREIDGTRRTLVVLVSDGRDPLRTDLAARGADARARLSNAGARLLLVAAGPDPDRELLAALAGASNPVLEAGDLARADAGERLARALGDALTQGSVAALDPPRAPSLAARDGDLARALADFAPPRLARLVRARATTGTQTLWSSDGGAPVLAVRRHGLSLSASFAFDADPAWIVEARELAGALSTVVRAAARTRESAALHVALDDGEIVLAGLPDGAPALLAAELVDGRGARLASLELAAARAGRDPLRERSAPVPAALDTRAPGAVVVLFFDLGGPRRLVLTLPRAPEHARVAATFVPPPAAPDAGSRMRAAHPSAPWVLLLGLAALFGAAGWGFFSQRGRRTA